MDSIVARNAEAVDLMRQGSRRRASSVVVGAIFDLQALLRDLNYQSFPPLRVHQCSP